MQGQESAKIVEEGKERKRVEEVCYVRRSSVYVVMQISDSHSEKQYSLITFSF